MPDQPYSNRELDQKFREVADTSDANRIRLTEKLDDLSRLVAEGFKRTDENFSGVHTRQDTANHKVAKIIIALVLLAGVCIGLGFQQAPTFLKFFI